MDDAPRGSFWVLLGIFVLIGPFIGGVLVGVVSFSDRSWAALGWREVLSLPGAGLMGYLMGFWPAVLTGAFCGWISSRVLSKVRWVLLATAAGAVFSGITSADIPDSWRYFAPIGAASAFCCALIGTQVRPRWRN